MRELGGGCVTEGVGVAYDDVFWHVPVGWQHTHTHTHREIVICAWVLGDIQYAPVCVCECVRVCVYSVLF